MLVAASPSLPRALWSGALARSFRLRVRSVPDGSSQYNSHLVGTLRREAKERGEKKPKIREIQKKKIASRKRKQTTGQ